MHPKGYSLILLAVAFLALPLAAQAQSVDCDNLPTSTGPVPAEVRDACFTPSPVVVQHDSDPSDLSAGINNSQDTFVTFTQEEPGFFTTVGGPISQSESAFINAGDFMGNDLSTWYALDNENNLFSVSAFTADVTPIAVTEAPEGSATWTGMTWDYATETMYAIAAGTDSYLYTLDVSTGEIALVGTMTEGGDNLPIAIGSDPFDDGQLYVMDLGTDELLAVDKTTAEVTSVGPLGFDANFGQGMDFDNDDGTCYFYAISVDGGNASDLRICDTTDGSSTVVGGLGALKPGGLNQMGSGSSMTEFKSVSNEETATAQSVTLGQNYPNPVIGRTTVPFSLERAEQVRISVVDALGREVLVAADEAFAAGPQTVELDLTGLPSGIYVYRVATATETFSQKLVVMQ